MNPILLSALSGLTKGLIVGRHVCARCEQHRMLHSVLIAPMTEELLFRSALQSIPSEISSGLFAAVHFSSLDQIRDNPGASALRFADVFLGGQLYHQAFTKWGLGGAFAAHALHNLMGTLGAVLMNGSGHHAVRIRPAPRKFRR